MTIIAAIPNHIWCDRMTSVEDSPNRFEETKIYRLTPNVVVGVYGDTVTCEMNRRLVSNYFAKEQIKFPHRSDLADMAMSARCRGSGGMLVVTDVQVYQFLSEKEEYGEVVQVDCGSSPAFAGAGASYAAGYYKARMFGYGGVGDQKKTIVEAMEACFEVTAYGCGYGIDHVQVVQ